MRERTREREREIDREREKEREREREREREIERERGECDIQGKPTCSQVDYTTAGLDCIMALKYDADLYMESKNMHFM